jgi:hypothetical protein
LQLLTIQVFSLLFIRKIEKATLITLTKDKKNSVAKVLVAVGQTSRRLVNDKIPFLL